MSKKKIFIIMLAIIVLFLFVGCKNNDKVVDDTNNKEENIEEQQNNNEELKEQEPTNTDEPKEKEKGSLYVHYVFNNGKNDVIDKVLSIEKYNFIQPKKEGYRFDGWYRDPELEIELDKSILIEPIDENDVIIYAYADWSIATYLVKFMCDGHLLTTQYVKYGESAREPKATFKSGYRFVGWDKDFSTICDDIVVNAIYEENNSSKNVMVILGNWMNNDGTISSTMRTRLELALKLYSQFPFDYIVVTGGMANAQAGISEAQAMFDYLTGKGIDPNIIIKEDQSMSTEQNAKYTMVKLENIDFKNLIIVSTIEHFVNYSTIKYFNDAARNNTKIWNKGINIMIYTNNGAY